LKAIATPIDALLPWVSPFAVVVAALACSALMSTVPVTFTPEPLER